jgi:hypothetical protein
MYKLVRPLPLARVVIINQRQCTSSVSMERMGSDAYAYGVIRICCTTIQARDRVRHFVFKYDVGTRYYP